MRPLKIVIFILVLLAGTKYVAAQDSAIARLRKISQNLQDVGENTPRENIYVQTDKYYYAAEDTIRLKAYVLNANLFATTQSGIVYLEFIDAGNRIVKRQMLQLLNGLGQASVALDKKEFFPGSYTLRCYTNWMRNFGADNFYLHTFYVGGSSADNWLINAAVGRNKNIGTAGLQFARLDGTPLILNSMQIDAYQGSRRISSQKVITGTNGDALLNFTLPDTLNNNVQLVVRPQEKSLNDIFIPINFDDIVKSDIQFLPEGGILLGNYRSKIAFKAIDANGIGIEVSGEVFNSKNERVCDFNTAHNGMGTFELFALAGESYAAKVRFKNGKVITYKLPDVKTTGTSLRVAQLAKDSLLVTLASSPDASGDYLLIAQSRNSVCYSASVHLEAGLNAKKIATGIFPSGVTHIMLLNQEEVPQNERLVFIDGAEEMSIKVDERSKTNHPGDSIALSLKVYDDKGVPLPGSFSITVTDDKQIDVSKDINPNIWVSMYLMPELKGYLEEPSYYYNLQGTTRLQAIDQLLLTQGWVNWAQISTPRLVAYQPEQEFQIRGRVTGFFGKGVANKDMSLIGLKQGVYLTSKTDLKGNFTFTGMPAGDSLKYNIQVLKKTGNSSSIGLTVEDPFLLQKPNVINHLKPWFLNTDSIGRTFAQNVVKQKLEKDYLPGGNANMLKEVRIKARRAIRNSRNLLGPGTADQVFDTEEFLAAGKQSVLNFLRDNLKNFNTDGRWYFLGPDSLFIIVDGQPLHGKPFFAFDDYREWAMQTSAENIIGIEVIQSGWALYHDRYGYSPEDIVGNDNPLLKTYKPALPRSRGGKSSYLEITTRSGQGPLRTTSGTYVYKPLSFATDKQFYQPKYKVKDAALLANDLRSTIFWQPDVVTDSNGQANVSFYAAGQKGTYTYIIEGCDLNGHIVYKTGKIKIE